MRNCCQSYFPADHIVLPFIRPPYYALLLAPLSWLTPASALLAWLAVNALGWAAGLWATAKGAGIRLSEAAWHGAIFFPTLFAFADRQDVPLLLLPAAAGYYLLARGSQFSAGLALAFCAPKFHLLLLIPLVLLIRKNWRAIMGLGTGAGFLVGISSLLVGPEALAAYLRMLIARGQPNMEFPAGTANLWQLAQGTGLEVPSVALAVIATGIAAWRGSPVEALAAGWLGSLLVVPHVYLADYTLALPACLVLGRSGKIAFLASLLLLFPVVPILMIYGKRFLLATPLLGFLCLVGAAGAILWKARR